MKTKLLRVLYGKIVATMFGIALILFGICFVSNDVNKVYAASELDTTTYADYAFKTYTGTEAKEYVGLKVPDAEEGYVFAGWYTKATCKLEEAVKSNASVADSSSVTYYAKYVPEDVLSIRLQVSTKEDVNDAVEGNQRNMRVVSSVDTLNYSKVGFRLKYREGNDETNPWIYKKNTAEIVYERIESATEGDEYKFSPKVVDTKSEYFMTATWKGDENTGISESDFDTNYYIRAYWETLDGMTVYGPTRYVSVNDGLNTNIVNMSVKNSEWNEESILTTDAYTGATVSVTYQDGAYAHLKINLGDGVNRSNVLKSLTKFTITNTGDSSTETAFYRNLYTKYTGTQDRSWYDAYVDTEGNITEDEFVVATAADLYGLANVVMKNDDVFTDKKVYMVSDIVVNKGEAAITGWTPDDGEEQYPWVKIGTYDNPFDGVFDGQGHTIDGVVLETSEACNGLFGRTGAKSNLKNFILKNSYLEYTGTSNARFGGIAGLGAGTFENIKSEAFIVSSHINNGGIIGKAEGTTTITGCWYSGTMSLVGTNAKNSGGIVGIIEGDIDVTLSQCLYDGQISGEATATEAYGGLCGNLYGNAELKTTDCLVVGSVSSASNNFIGAIVGYIYGSDSTTATLRVNNTYVKEGMCARAIRYRGYGVIYYENDAAVSTDIASNTYKKRVSSEDIIGYNEWYNNYPTLELDFTTYWCLADNTTPQLRKLAEKDDILTTLSGLGTEVNPWIISTKEEMIAFSDMAQEHDFSGKNVNLGTDEQKGQLVITINEGTTVDEVKASNPTNWTPIGSESLPFAGIFNGNGNTISGLYYKGSDTYIGLFGCIANSSTVKNLILSDTCYFESEKSNATARIGSVAGCVQGTLDTIRSEATVVSIGHENGGIAGAVYYTGAASSSVKEVKFTNVWFGGTLTMTTSVGRFSGGIVGKIYAPNRDIVMEHCLVTGTITAARTDSNSQLGGIIGQANSYRALSISDSLVGSVIQNVNIDTGAIIGTVNDSDAYTLQDVYGVDGIGVNGTTYDHGITGTNVPGTMKEGSVCSIVDVEAIKGYDGWYTTTLDFDNYWEAIEGNAPELKSFASKDKILTLLVGEGTEASPWIISTKEEMIAFVDISQKHDFAGKYVNLGTDEQKGKLVLTINEGDTVDEVKTYAVGEDGTGNWTPIGTASLPFAGTFNGNGNTIRGLYYKGSGTYVGLFGCIANSATVKNLKLSNTCYFESENSNASTRIGSVVGCLQGTLDTIKSEATVVSIGHENGGIVGAVYYTGAASTSVKEVKLSNVWFAGTLTMTTAVGRMSGGIIGKIYAPNRDIVMEHCLVTGTITAARTDSNSQLGGMIGQANDYRALTISDSLVGSVIQNVNKDTGAIIGTVNETNAYTLQNVYGVDGKAVNETTYDHGVTGTNVPGTMKEGSVCSIVDIEAIKGYDGWYTTTLDFDNYWVAVEDAVPELKSFANADKILTTLRGKGTEASPWIVSTKDELIALANVSQKHDYAGKYVNIGTENEAGTLTITINEGDSIDEIIASNPTNWMPIGTSSLPFAGTFNGNGNTISGLYYKGSGTYVGLFGCIANSATVKNLKLSNTCYFESVNSNTTARMGSVAGCVQGTLDTIKSEATIVSIGHENGGIAGAVNYGGAASTDIKEVKFANVWFDGALTMTTAVGRFSGGIVGKIYAPNRDIIMEHCLVTGTITAARTDSNSQLGGMIGQANDYRTLTISDSLVGSVIQNVNIDTGAIIGTVNETNAYTLQNVYGVDGKAVNGTTYDHGITGTNVPGTMKEGSVCKVVDIETIKGDGAWLNTALDFDNYWTPIVDATPELKAFPTGTALIIWEGEGTEASPWILYNADELWRMTNASQYHRYTDEFLQLGADITINEGTVEEIKESKPTNWRPIGVSNAPFDGSFDGNGYTISGVYYKGSRTHVGLFAVTGTTSSVKNLKLTNSYFEATLYSDITSAADIDEVHIGSIAGVAYGTYKNIKSDAEVVCYGTCGGGIAGSIWHYGDATLDDCWFAGSLSVQGYASQCGGIVGRIDATGQVDITNCLNSGTIVITSSTADVARVGGICGFVTTAQIVNITNCLNAKSFATTRERIGSIIGAIEEATANVCITNSYAIKGTGSDDSYNDYAYCGYTIEGATITETDCALLTSEQLAGENARTYAPALFVADANGDVHWATGVLYPILNMQGEAEAAIPTIAASTSSNTTTLLTGDGNFVTSVTETTKVNYTEYLSSLETAGFESVAENTLSETVYSTTYTRGNLVLCANYFVNEGKTTISYYEGPISEHLVYDESYVADNKQDAQTTLHMIELFEYGNSFVIQLKNGHFIISDGGFKEDLPYLLDYLEELTGGDKPVIEAWFITHAHGDHTGAFNDFWNHRNWLERVYVEGVYYSSPSDEILNDPDCGVASLDHMIKWVTNLLKTENGETTKLYRPQTGQRYYFNDTTLDILLAQEQLALDGSDGYRPNLNSSSTVCLFTSEAGTSNAQTCLFSGDLQEDGFDILFANYGADMFVVDFFTLNHHGFNTSATIAKNITANTVLLTVRGDTPVRCATAITYLTEKAEESVAWGNGTVVFAFPHTAGTDPIAYTILPSKDEVDSEGNNGWIYNVGETREEQPNLYVGTDGTTTDEFE